MLDLRFFPDISDVVNVALYIKEFDCIYLHCFVFIRLLSQSISNYHQLNHTTIIFYTLNYVFKIDSVKLIKLNLTLEIKRFVELHLEAYQTINLSERL